MRSLASRANYGKSTVHEAFGSTDALLAELRVNACNAMVQAAIGDNDPDPTDPAWREGVFRPMATWVLAEPNWAEICFGPGIESEPSHWTRPLSILLSGGLPAGAADLDRRDRDHITLLASRSMAAVVPLVIAIADVDYGAKAIRRAHDLAYECLVELLELRGLETKRLPPERFYN